MSSAARKLQRMSSFMTLRSATYLESLICQPLLAKRVGFIMTAEKGSLAKVFMSPAGAVVNHLLRDNLLMTFVACDSFTMVLEFPESFTIPTFLFPICSVVFLGSFL